MHGQTNRCDRPALYSRGVDFTHTDWLRRPPTPTPQGALTRGSTTLRLKTVYSHFHRRMGVYRCLLARQISLTNAACQPHYCRVTWLLKSQGLSHVAHVCRCNYILRRWFLVGVIKLAWAWYAQLKNKYILLERKHFQVTCWQESYVVTRHTYHSHTCIYIYIHIYIYIYICT